MRLVSDPGHEPRLRSNARGSQLAKDLWSNEAGISRAKWCTITHPQRGHLDTVSFQIFNSLHFSVSCKSDHQASMLLDPLTVPGRSVRRPHHSMLYATHSKGFTTAFPDRSSLHTLVLTAICDFPCPTLP